MKIIVLNDGETYSDAHGCKVIEIPDEFGPDDIEDALRNMRHNISDVNVYIMGTFDERGTLKSRESDVMYEKYLHSK